MKDLSIHDLARCRECGRLISIKSSKGLCGECGGAGEAPAPGDNAASAAPFSHLREGETCVRCKLRHVLQGSEFCLNCQVELVSELGDNAKQLFVKLENIEEQPPISLGIRGAYSSKRRRTASSRINVVGGRQLKWWKPT